MEKLTELAEFEGKLQLLESRALALEGVYCRLPADQLVIQQIEQAGVATLQETATTAASRFANIKMTLLTLHGALAVKGVQRLSLASAQLDKQLTEMRGVLMRDVVQAASNAPAENRLAQVEQLRTVIAETKAINDIVQKAKFETKTKFETARIAFTAARQELATISSG
jgi:HPt (histidine-containing phosphotransfer) domain-containing protein